jgi:SHS2 domain-containing protein
LRIEAWGPTREDYIADAVRGVVESSADVDGAGYQYAIERHLTAASDADLLAAADLLAEAVEEVIYALDAGGEVPVVVEVARAADGGIDLRCGEQVPSLGAIGSRPYVRSRYGPAAGAAVPGQLAGLS